MNGDDTTALIEGSDTYEEDIRCPGCGHLNPAGLARCERCTGPLNAPTGHYYASPSQYPARPGCVTLSALLLILFGCLYVPAACYWTIDILSTPIPIWPLAPFIIVALAAIPLAVVPLTLGSGLWQQKNWARQAVIGLLFFGTSVAGYSFLKALSSPAEGRILILTSSAGLLIVGGITVRWFVNNGKYFE